MTASIQGHPVDPTPLAVGQTYTWDGAKLVPTTPTIGGVTTLANIIHTTTESIQSGTAILVPGMTATVPCAAGKTQEIHVEFDVYLGNIGNANESELLWFFIYVDGLPVVGKHVRNSSSTTYAEVSCSLHYETPTPLLAGNHTFALYANSANGSKFANLNTFGDSTTPIVMTVKEF